MRIVGIDPGYANLGISILEAGPSGRARWVGGQRVQTPATMPLPQRFAMCADAILAACAGADVVAFESQEGVLAGKNREGETGARAQRANVIVGMIWAASRARNISGFLATPPLEVSPRSMRSALGLAPDAAKSQVAQMIARLVDDVPLPCSEHVTDAAAVAYAAWRQSLVTAKRKM